MIPTATCKLIKILTRQMNSYRHYRIDTSFEWFVLSNFYQSFKKKMFKFTWRHFPAQSLRSFIRFKYSNTHVYTIQTLVVSQQTWSRLRHMWWKHFDKGAKLTVWSKTSRRIHEFCLLSPKRRGNGVQRQIRHQL